MAASSPARPAPNGGGAVISGLVEWKEAGCAAIPVAVADMASVATRQLLLRRVAQLTPHCRLIVGDTNDFAAYAYIKEHVSAWPNALHHHSMG